MIQRIQAIQDHATQRQNFGMHIDPESGGFFLNEAKKGLFGDKETDLLEMLVKMPGTDELLLSAQEDLKRMGISKRRILNIFDGFKARYFTPEKFNTEMSDAVSFFITKTKFEKINFNSFIPSKGTPVERIERLIAENSPPKKHRFFGGKDQ